MLPESVSCLRCKTTMEHGFIADSTYGGNVQEKWSPGPPQTSIWRGLKIDNEQAHRVITFRCPNCGYLESYAR
jgi:predicted nucleic-acid-binding Zn-ribbon protein